MIEAEGKQLGELNAGDFFGELGVLVRPGSCKDDKTGLALNGHRRLRSAYASKMDVTLGILSYDDLERLMIERPQIARLVLPYYDAIGLHNSDLKCYQHPPAQGDWKAFSSADKDGDGMVSRDEFHAYVQGGNGDDGQRQQQRRAAGQQQQQQEEAERRLEALVDARVEARVEARLNQLEERLISRMEKLLTSTGGGGGNDGGKR